MICVRAQPLASTGVGSVALLLWYWYILTYLHYRGTTPHAQVLPLYCFVIRRRQWSGHRGLIMIILRMIMMATSCIYVKSWTDSSNLDKSLQSFVVFGLLMGSNWTSMVFW